MFYEVGTESIRALTPTLESGELTRSVDYSMEAEEGRDDTDTVQITWADDLSDL